MIFFFNSFNVLFSLVFVFHYCFSTRLRANPKYSQRLKQNRCWHVDAEGGRWNRPCKAAGEAAPVFLNLAGGLLGWMQNPMDLASFNLESLFSFSSSVPVSRL